MQRIPKPDAKRVGELQDLLGDRTLRTLLTSEDKRLMRPDRLRNLAAGRGKLSASEQERLQQISRNAPLLKRLKEKETSDERKGKARKDYKVNRALRQWVTKGKGKGVPKPADDLEAQRQRQAIQALGFFGIDPSEGTYYVRKEAA